MKKAQTEIFGLVVIVLLISVAMLFVITFLVKKEPSTYKKEFQQEEIGANWLNAFLKTTSMECGGNDMTDLVIDCAENPSLPLISCNGDSSCEYLHDKTGDLLAQSLLAWNYNNYKITFIKKPGDINILGSYGAIEAGECSGEKRASLYIIPVYGGQVNIKLEICG